jgi:hypothetical protein
MSYQNVDARPVYWLGAMLLMRDTINMVMLLCWSVVSQRWHVASKIRMTAVVAVTSCAFITKGRVAEGESPCQCRGCIGGRGYACHTEEGGFHDTVTLGYDTGQVRKKCGTQVLPIPTRTREGGSMYICGATAKPTWRRARDLFCR